MGRLDNKIALVSGGARGLGAATARTFAREGARVAVADIDFAEAQKTAADIGASAKAYALDVTDEASVGELAASIGGKVDILVNTAEFHRPNTVSSPGVETARAEMEVNYFGLLRLAQGFGPALKSRGADGETSATAWVNILSIYALSNFPPHGTFSASKAAALSLAQALRADLQSAGIRVVNVFPGPIDDEWNQLTLPPKLSPEALAASVIGALERGIEDVYPGDVAKDWLARYEDDPKTLEREIAG